MANYQHCTLSIRTEKRNPELLRKIFYEMCSEYDALDFSKIIPEPEFEDTGDRFDEPRHNWFIANWGSGPCEVDAVHFSIDYLKYHFDTRNCVPYRVVLTLIQKYPELHIAFSSQEEINMDLLKIEHRPGELVHGETGRYLVREEISGSIARLFDFPIDGDIVKNFIAAFEDGNNNRHLVRLNQGLCGCKNYQGEWDKEYLDPISGEILQSPGDLVIDCVSDKVEYYYSSSTPRKKEEQVKEEIVEFS